MKKSRLVKVGVLVAALLLLVALLCVATLGFRKQILDVRVYPDWYQKKDIQLVLGQRQDESLATRGMTNCPGVPLCFSVPEKYGQDITFQLTTGENGHFNNNIGTSQYTAANGEKLYFTGATWKNASGQWQDQYITVVIYDGEHIIGYAVVELASVPNRYGYLGGFIPNLVECVWFPKRLGMYQPVTEEYVDQKLAESVERYYVG